MFLYKPSGSSIHMHLIHYRGLVQLGINLEKTKYGIMLAIFCWPIRFYTYLRKLPSGWKVSYDIANLHKYNKNWKAFLIDTNGFAFRHTNRIRAIELEKFDREKELED